MSIIKEGKKNPGTERVLLKDPAGNGVECLNSSGDLKPAEDSTSRHEAELAGLCHKPYETASALLEQYIRLSQSLQS